MDCDGNGIIDNDDALAITLNYTPMNAPNPTTETSAPLIHIDFDQDKIEEIAKKVENVSSNLEGKDIKKSIYIKGKIINFVV